MAMGGKKKPRTRFICWNCGQAVPLKFSGQACPNCGAPLTPAAYDARAQELAKQRAQVERELNRLQAQLDSATKKNTRWGIFKNFRFLPSRRAMDELLLQIQPLKQQIEDFSRKGRFASERYYASEWFRQSRRFLREDILDAREKSNNPFKMPYYDQSGVFHMAPDRGNAWKRGEYGEYVVFSLLSDAIDAGLLGHAPLLWHLYVPVRQRLVMRRVGTVESTDEIDIALLTTHGLYSIEVKSLYSSIEVRLDNCKDAYCVTATPVGQDGQILTNGITIDMG